MKFLIMIIFLHVAIHSVWGFEDSIASMLQKSYLGRESLIAHRIQYQQARNRISLSRANFYIAAPNAYELLIDLGTTQTIQTQFGVQGDWFHRISTNFSVSHMLSYRSDNLGTNQLPQSGFVQMLSGRFVASIPLVAEVSRPSDLFTNELRVADIQLSLAQNSLVHQFIIDWFELHRQRISLLVLLERVYQARLVVETYGLQLEQQTRPLYEYWQAQRDLTRLELELVQAETNQKRNIDLFEAVYGIVLPDLSILPPKIDWMSLGIMPRLFLESQLINVINASARYEYVNRKREIAPQLNFQLGINGPQSRTLTTFRGSIQQQFNSLDDWAASFGLGFSLSTNTLRSMTNSNVLYELDSQKRVLSQVGAREELLSQKRQLERLLTQYQQIVSREEYSLIRMGQVLEDVEGLTQIGYTQIEVGELRLEYIQLQSLLTRARSHLREVELHLELLGTE